MHIRRKKTAVTFHQMDNNFSGGAPTMWTSLLSGDFITVMDNNFSGGAPTMWTSLLSGDFIPVMIK